MRVPLACLLVVLGGVAGAQQPAAPPLAIRNATIYTTPTSEALADGVIVTRDGLIAEVGPASRVRIPADAQVLDAAGGTVVAGFQNSHVHFTEPKSAGAAGQPAGKLSTQLATCSCAGRLPLLPQSDTPATAVTGRNAIVFAHLSDIDGIEVALGAGVDVLAHASSAPRGLSSDHLATMKAADVASIPTPTLFAGFDTFPAILRQVGDYRRLGGQILFGTDVGFHDTYDPAREYELTERAGLSWRETGVADDEPGCEVRGARAPRDDRHRRGVGPEFGWSGSHTG